MTPSKEFSLACPIPIKDYPRILLAHGGGGTLMHDLIAKIFRTAFDNEFLDAGHDASVFLVDSGSLAMTTDSYVVHPMIFPGGDIGSLAIHGTVNDLTMAGAKPKYISAGFILEEGLEMETLWQVVQSMRRAADKAEVTIITGDTKVVDRGKGDGIYINTAGIGIIPGGVDIHPQRLRPGDKVILSGDLGRHGMAIMAVREGLEFESDIKSDSASLTQMVHAVLEKKIDVHCLRDVTRGGLATTLNELAQSAKTEIIIKEEDIPVADNVKAACEMLGFDPLYVACEGRCVLFVPAEAEGEVLKVLRQFPEGQQATVIGEVRESQQALVTLITQIGVERILDMLSGEQLPRIC